MRVHFSAVETIPVIPVPQGRWGAAVSGGADSVAMLLACQAGVACVLHFDHETRAGASTDDARFVEVLAARLGLACVTGRRSEYEQRVPAGGAASERFRRMRLAFYRDVTEREGLAGVLLAHHADDVAETVAMRLIRGAGPATLRGIAFDTTVGGVRLLRPMLGCRKAELLEFLRHHGQTFREDASNTSGAYARNRMRAELTPTVSDALLELCSAGEAYRRAIDAATPTLGPTFAAATLADLPAPMAEAAVRRWIARGTGHAEVTSDTVARLLAWSADAASPAGFNLPGGWHARRSRGTVRLERGA